MSELDEFDLSTPEADEPSSPLEPPPDSGGRLGLVTGVATALAVVVAAVTTYLLLRSPEEEALAPEPAIVVPAPPPSTMAAALPEPEPPLELPGLDESDDVIRGLAARLSANPELTAWLANKELVRTFVVVVDNVAAGESPANHLGFLEPEERFRAAGGAHPYLIDPRSYARYDRAADVFASLDAPGCARLLTALGPLIVEAYEELGYPEGGFDKTLDRAIAHLLATPAVEAEVALTPAVLSYRYADPELEALTKAQKHLLRMGPQNARRVKAKLRELAAAIAAPPPPVASPAPEATVPTRP